MKKLITKILCCAMVLLLLAGTGVSVCAAEDTPSATKGGIHDIPITQD